PFPSRLRARHVFARLLLCFSSRPFASSRLRVRLLPFSPATPSYLWVIVSTKTGGEPHFDLIPRHIPPHAPRVHGSAHARFLRTQHTYPASPLRPPHPAQNSPHPPRQNGG